MSTHDANGIEWVKLSELRPGDVIRLDEGFTCHPPGLVVVQGEIGNLSFNCDDGSHSLDGQCDDGEHCVGVYRS